jgi:hypothetical protein
MILEAFSHVLRQEYASDRPALFVLQAWLTQHLQKPEGQAATDVVTCVLHTELELQTLGKTQCFQARSPSGKVLLSSLYSYCRSYEDWQYRRWLHKLRASDFQNETGSSLA